MKLSEEQKRIVDSKEDKIVVMSAAASGKSFTLIEKVRKVLKDGVEPGRIVCITFTNNAADEIKTRLGDDYKDGMFIGTVHGYANYLLAASGRDTTQIRNSENFDDLFEMVMMYPEVIRPVDFLALDEAQDSSDKQFEFIFDMVEPKSFIIFGDVRQSIYGFNNANPDLILSLLRDEEIQPYNMIENHRNGREIISYSNWILGKMKSIPKSQVRAVRETSGLVEKVKEYQIIDMIKEDGNYGDWAILCRSNRRIQDFLYDLERAGIPAITFRQAQGDSKELRENMESDTVKVLTIHSAKGLEWNKVIVADQNWRGEENLRLMYVAATRARDMLFMATKR